MKKLTFLAFLMVALVGAVMISSCGGEGDDTPEPIGPTLQFLGGAEYVSSDVELTAETPFAVGIRGTHTENIEKLRVSVSINGANAGTLFDSSFKTKSLDYVFNHETGPAAQTEKYTFTLTDKNGVETSRSITITNTGSGGAVLKEFADGANGFKVWNVRGPNLGAFDLVANGPQASADPPTGKDIQDSVAQSDFSGSTINWPARWTSRNGTTFKKVTVSYESVINEGSLESAWTNGGTETSVLQAIKVGDVYIAKLRGGSDYVIINITEVVNTPSDNLDYIAFKYKK
jgi:hypothetical protein